MKPILAAAASAALVLAPLAGVAQTEDQITEQLNREQLQSVPEQSASQGDDDGTVATPAQTTALPTLGGVPTGAIVVGGLVILGGVAIGIAAGNGGSSSTTTTTTTN